MAELNAQDLDRIAEAVTAAEAGTSGEVACILTEEVSAYPEIPLAFGMAAALVIPPLALAAGLGPVIQSFSPAAWSAGHAAALEAQTALVLLLYAVGQTMLCLAAGGLAAIPSVRRRLTPRIIRRRKVEMRARQSFAAMRLAASGVDQTVLIFVSWRDRQVQVLAGPAIHAQAAAGAWDRAARAVEAGISRGDGAGGIIDAIVLVGAELKTHFPFEGEDPNRVSNAPVQS
jgi:putative membrane protein